MQADNVEIDPVALYTADELYDLDDATISSRRRTSPAVYQELQARVRREHRAIRGLVRTTHPVTGTVVDAVALQLPGPSSASNPEQVATRLTEALLALARRFLAGGGAAAGLAEVSTADRRVHVVGFDPSGDAATCWVDGEVVEETSLRAVLGRLLR